MQTKNGEKPCQQINVFGYKTMHLYIPEVRQESRRGKPLLVTRFSWMRTKIQQWSRICRGTAKKHIFLLKFLNCVTKLSFHLHLIKSMLLDSLNLTTSPQTTMTIDFVVIQHVPTLEAVHNVTNCLGHALLYVWVVLYTPHKKSIQQTKL